MAEPDPHQDVADAERSDAEVRDALRDDSQALLGALDRLRTLESAKRKVRMSTPEFHQKAEEIEDIARGVFGLAARERAHGDDLRGPQQVSIADEAADHEDRQG